MIDDLTREPEERTNDGTADVRGKQCRRSRRDGPILAENKTVREFLEKTVGKEGSRPALELLKTGQLDEGLADLLYEAIEDEATTAWEGMLGDDPEGFSVCVMGWGGVFFVQTPEFDDVGYFRTVEDAVEYIRANWDDVTEM